MRGATRLAGDAAGAGETAGLSAAKLKEEAESAQADAAQSHSLFMGSFRRSPRGKSLLPIVAGRWLNASGGVKSSGRRFQGSAWTAIVFAGALFAGNVGVDHGVRPGEYSDVVLFLATAGVVVPLFKRLKISPILGFLGAGVALGPFGLGALARQQPWLRPLAVANPKDIAELAEFGVVFLLFMVGLELSWERLRLLRRSVFGLGAAQTVLSLGALAAVAAVFGQTPASALAIG